MKQTKYIIRNNTRSEGTYFSNGEYKIIYPGEEILADTAPLTKTANVTVIVFKQTVNEKLAAPLNKKIRK